MTDVRSARVRLVTVDDLDDDAIEEILAEARSGVSPLAHRAVLGNVFLTESTRTRLGFAVAMARLGGSSVDLVDLRTGASMSASESVADTLRTVSGMVDVVVMRSDVDDLAGLVADNCRSAFVNGGNGGSAAEHPTQALIDLAAMRRHHPRLGDAHVVVSGDLCMRSVRSLLRLWGRRPPGRVTLLSPPARAAHGVVLAPSLAAVTATDDDPGSVDWRSVDLLYLPGLPARRGGDLLDAAERARFAFTRTLADQLPRTARILSPLPVIDEVADDARGDDRVVMFEDSDRAVAVRAAVLRWCLVSLTI